MRIQSSSVADEGNGGVLVVVGIEFAPLADFVLDPFDGGQFAA
jgi:hypothetical protein